MAVVTIWILDVDDVDPTVDTLRTLVDRGFIDLYDAATVHWPAHAAQPTTTSLTDIDSDQSLDPAFWGMLFGLTFFASELGPSLGPTSTRVREQIEALGIDSSITEQLRDKLRPGKGALFAFSSGRYAETGENREEIEKVLKGIPAELIRTNVSGEAAARVLDTFGASATRLAGAPVATIDLADTYVHLDGTDAPTVDGGGPFWEALLGGGGTERHDAIRRGGWLVTTAPYEETWPTWEMHPNGDEVVSCLRGLIDLRIEFADAERTVQLSPGKSVVVPAGFWHTATVIEAGACLHITAGSGTQVRPA